MGKNVWNKKLKEVWKREEKKEKLINRVNRRT